MSNEVHSKDDRPRRRPPWIRVQAPSGETYAEIRAALERIGKPIGANDLLIASIARTHDMTLVTANLNEFERIEGLKIENWELSAQSSSD